MASRELSILVKAIGAAKAAREIGKVDKATRGIGKAGKIIGAGVAAAVGVGAIVVGRNVRAGIESLAELEDATTSVDGAIATLGLTGQITSQQIAGWANEIEANTEAAFDDKAITASTETLLRYGKVAPRNIRPAMEVMTDLAARTGSVESASVLLAKALADPAKAAGKLARSGVVLTKSQQDQIKAMVEAGDVAGAQSFLLAELAKTTEGAAKASAGPYRDSMNILADVTEDAQRALGEGFMPVIQEVRDILTEELSKPSTIENIRNFGKALAGGLRGLIDIAKGLPWGLIGDSLKMAGAGAKIVLDAFLGLPPWIQGAIATGWGLNKLSGGFLGGIASGLIKGVLGMTAGVVNAKAGVVNVTGGAAGAGGAATGGGGVGAAVGGAVIAGAVVQGAMDVGTIATGFQRGYEASQQGDIEGVIGAQKDILRETVMLPPGLRELGQLITGEQEKAIQQANSKSNALAQVQRASSERIRNATMAARDATRSTGAATVAAINRIKLQTNITVPVYLNGQRLTNLQSATFLHRATTLNRFA